MLLSSSIFLRLMLENETDSTEDDTISTMPLVRVITTLRPIYFNEAFIQLLFFFVQNGDKKFIPSLWNGDIGVRDKILNALSFFHFFFHPISYLLSFSILRIFLYPFPLSLPFPILFYKDYISRLESQK